MAFTRKMANKLDELSRKNTEVQNFLESIPEWADFFQNVIAAVNAIEAKALGSDPRARDNRSSSADDFLDIMAKFNNSGTRPGSGFSNKKFVGSSHDNKQKNNNDEEDEEEEDDDDTNDRVEEDEDEDGNDHLHNNNNNQEENDQDDEEENRNKDLHLS